MADTGTLKQVILSWPNKFGLSCICNWNKILLVSTTRKKTSSVKMWIEYDLEVIQWQPRGSGNYKYLKFLTLLLDGRDSHHMGG